MRSSRKVKVPQLVVSDSLRPQGLYSPWNSPGQNTGVGSLSLLQEIFPTQGSNPGLPHCGRILYQLSHQGSPRILEWVADPFSSRSSWPRSQTGICIAGGFFANWATREALVIHSKLPVHPCPSPWQPQQVCSLCLWLCFCFIRVYLFHTLDSTHKWCHIMLICLSLSDWLHLSQSSLGPSMLLQMAKFHSFLWLNNIPLCISTISYLFIYLLISHQFFLAVLGLHPQCAHFL